VKTPRIVIIGAGFGGLEVAKNLKNAQAQIIVVDGRNYFLFQPLLYQVATAGLSPADIAAPIRGVLRHQKNTDVVMKKVTGVDLKAQEVIAENERIPFDYLVLATGAHHGYFGHDNWEKFAPGLKSISDATKIRRNILLAFEAAELEPDPEKRKALLTFIIVGAGPTGVELAGAISELSRRALASDFRHIDPRSAKIILIEASPQILASFPQSLSKSATEALLKHGVEIRTNSRVGEINNEGVSIGSQKISAKTVIWAAGVVASPAGKWINADMDYAGRIKVRSDLSVPGHINIFAIGDTAAFTQDGKLLPGVSPVAMQEGRYLARLIKARIKGKEFKGEFHYFNKGNLATVGRSFAVADLGAIKFAGFFAWVAWLVVHIYYLIGFRNRLLVIIQWAWAYLTFKPGARLIVAADEDETSGD
jgi:NADH:ubiquinone reductase (H+-translocating)